MKNYSLLTIIVASAAVMPIASFAKPNHPEWNDKVPAVSEELLIQFTSTATDADKKRVLNKVGGNFKETIASKRQHDNGHGDLDLVRHALGLNRDDVKNSIESDSSVEFVEPNYIYTHQSVSNDPYYTNGSLWGMQATNQFGSKASDAWSKGQTNCSSVYVGIIDEGYMYTHVDLAANVGVNTGEIAGNRKDDDGNGLVDDVYGWDFNDNNNSVFDGINDDHGTHVAGTIGGVGGNKVGVVGMCWSVKLLNAKFLGSTGGTLANAVKAVDYFTDLKKRGINIVATNNSWGGGGYSQALRDVIERANQSNIIFVAAAGNASSNNDTLPSYPASYDNANVISVASIASNGQLSTFSNYGATTVDLAAPGTDIWSTVPVLKGAKIDSGYAKYSGTSMATPHVTGACALYAALHPDAPVSEIKNAILNTTQPTTSLIGKVATQARLDVSKF